MACRKWLLRLASVLAMMVEDLVVAEGAAEVAVAVAVAMVMKVSG